MRKEQLEQYRELCLEIKELEDEKESLSELASSWTISPRRIQGTASDVTANLADKLLQLAEIIAKRINELVLMRIEVEEFIGKLPIQESILLRLYYVRGLTWSKLLKRWDIQYDMLCVCAVKYLVNIVKTITRRLFISIPCLVLINPKISVIIYRWC